MNCSKKINGEFQQEFGIYKKKLNKNFKFKN